MIDDRLVCVCGHPASDHDHFIADCYRCECCALTDQNELVTPTPPAGADGAVMDAGHLT